MNVVQRHGDLLITHLFCCSTLLEKKKNNKKSSASEDLPALRRPVINKPASLQSLGRIWPPSDPGCCPAESTRTKYWREQREQKCNCVLTLLVHNKFWSKCSEFRRMVFFFKMQRQTNCSVLLFFFPTAATAAWMKISNFHRILIPPYGAASLQRERLFVSAHLVKCCWLVALPQPNWLLRLFHLIWGPLLLLTCPSFYTLRGFVLFGFVLSMRRGRRSWGRCLTASVVFKVGAAAPWGGGPQKIGDKIRNKMLIHKWII